MPAVKVLTLTVVCVLVVLNIAGALDQQAGKVAFPFTDDFEANPFQPSECPRWKQVIANTYTWSSDQSVSPSHSLASPFGAATNNYRDDFSISIAGDVSRASGKSKKRDKGVPACTEQYYTYM